RAGRVREPGRDRQVPPIAAHRDAGGAEIGDRVAGVQRVLDADGPQRTDRGRPGRGGPGGGGAHGDGGEDGGCDEAPAALSGRHVLLPLSGPVSTTRHDRTSRQQIALATITVDQIDVTNVTPAQRGAGPRAPSNRRAAMCSAMAMEEGAAGGGALRMAPT